MTRNAIFRKMKYLFSSWCLSVFLECLMIWPRFYSWEKDQNKLEKSTDQQCFYTSAIWDSFDRIKLIFEWRQLQLRAGTGSHLQSLWGSIALGLSIFGILIVRSFDRNDHGLDFDGDDHGLDYWSYWCMYCCCLGVLQSWYIQWSWWWQLLTLVFVYSISGIYFIFTVNRKQKTEYGR